MLRLLEKTETISIMYTSPVSARPQLSYHIAGTSFASKFTGVVDEI